MDQYRNLVIHSVAKMKDSCRVYDYMLDIDKKWIEDDGKLEGMINVDVFSTRF